MPMGQWGVQMLLVDWLVERPAACLWEVGCHSDPDTEPEYRAGTALMADLLGKKQKGAMKAELTAQVVES